MFTHGAAHMVVEKQRTGQRRIKVLKKREKKRRKEKGKKSS